MSPTLSWSLWAGTVLGFLFVLWVALNTNDDDDRR